MVCVAAPRDEWIETDKRGGGENEMIGAKIIGLKKMEEIKLGDMDDRKEVVR